MALAGPPSSSCCPSDPHSKSNWLAPGLVSQREVSFQMAKHTNVKILNAKDCDILDMTINKYVYVHTYIKKIVKLRS